MEFGKTDSKFEFQFLAGISHINLVPAIGKRAASLNSLPSLVELQTTDIQPEKSPEQSRYNTPLTQSRRPSSSIQSTTTLEAEITRLSNIYSLKCIETDELMNENKKHKQTIHTLEQYFQTSSLKVELDKNEIPLLNEKIAALNIQLTNTTVELKKAHDKVSFLETEKNEFIGFKKKATEKFIGLRNENRGLNENNDKLQVEIKSLNERYAVLMNECNSSQEKVAKLQTENKQDQVKNIAAQKSKETIQKFEVEIKSLTDERTKLVNNSNLFEDKVTKYEKELKVLNEDKIKLNNSLKNSEDIAVKYQIEIKVFSEKIKSLLNLNKTMEDKINKLQNEIKVSNEKNASLCNSNALSEEKLFTFQNEIKYLQEELEKITDKDVQSQKESKALNERITSLVSDAQKLNEKNIQLQHEINSLTILNKEIETSSKQSESKLKDRITQIESLLKNSEEHINKMSARLARHQKTTQSGLSTSAKKILLLTSENSELVNENKELLDKFAKIQEQLNTSNMELEHDASVILELQDKYKRSQCKVDELTIKSKSWSLSLLQFNKTPTIVKEIREIKERKEPSSALLHQEILEVKSALGNAEARYNKLVHLITGIHQQVSNNICTPIEMLQSIYSFFITKFEILESRLDHSKSEINLLQETIDQLNQVSVNENLQLRYEQVVDIIRNLTVFEGGHELKDITSLLQEAKSICSELKGPEESEVEEAAKVQKINFVLEFMEELWKENREMQRTILTLKIALKARDEFVAELHGKGI